MRVRRQEFRQKNNDDVCSENAAAANALRRFNRDVLGKPCLEVNQPEIISAIVNIVQASSAADDRRRKDRVFTYGKDTWRFPRWIG